MPQISKQLSNPQRLLPALFFLAVAALNTGSSGGVRFGGDEDDGSGFGGTGRVPTGGSGLGGTGLRPFLGDAGEVRIHFEPDAIVIAGQVVEEDIRRIPEASGVLPPVTVVTAAEFAAEHTAEIAITDSIQTRLQRDAVIYERILEGVEGYYPPETDRNSSRMSTPEQAPERQLTGTGQQDTEDAAVEVAEADVADAGPDPAPITWAELARYLTENGAAANAENSAAVQRPDRIRRPELPQVQRGRVVRRPAILPPRVQPMLF